VADSPRLVTVELPGVGLSLEAPVGRQEAVSQRQPPGLLSMVLPEGLSKFM